MRVIREGKIEYKPKPWAGVKVECPNCHTIIQLYDSDHVTEVPGSDLGLILCPTNKCGRRCGTQLRIGRDMVKYD